MANPLKTLEKHLTSISPPASTSPSIPGVVLLATTKDASKLAYTFACGVASVHPVRSPAPALKSDSTFWFASATKLLTSIAALQLVDRGLWTLDRPVADALPELASLRELKDWTESGEPVYADDVDGKPAGARVTLRHLLTHTSGLAYDFLNPKLMRWWKWRGQVEGRDVRAEAQGRMTEMYGGALVREPGTGWEYGPSIDWVGALIEKLYGEEKGRVGRVIQREVLAKVDVKDGEAVFRRSDSTWSEEEIGRRWADLVVRSPEGLKHSGPLPPETSKDDLGGASIRCPAQEWIKVLESLLRNDGRLLNSDTAESLLFKPQLVNGEGLLGAELGRSLQAFFASGPGGRMLTGGLPSPSKPDDSKAQSSAGQADEDEYEFNHSLAGALSRKTGQKEWALHWGGAPNIQWFIEPAVGVAGVFATQTLPPADPVMLDLAFDYRKAVVEVLGRK